MLKNEEKLEGLDERLIHIVNVVSDKYDTVILEGLRTQERQKQLFKEGKTKTLKSKHLKGKALDRSPYPIPDNWGKIDLSMLPEETQKIIWNQIKELCKFYHYAGYELATADLLGKKIRWGGDWDCDKEFKDQAFDDLVHIELLD